MSYSLPFRWISLALVALFTVALGCGPTGPVMHPISGKVTFVGNAVKEGTITFEDPKTGAAQRADLMADGTYTVKLQEGSYQVCVEPMVIERAANADTPPDYAYKKADDIPLKYRATAESGVKYTVSGPGTFDLDMKR